MQRRDYTRGKVRDFELTQEDAARLAECFNSFDDSDSWPGGFTQGNPYTAERILDEYRKKSNVRILVAYDGDRIVGHCNVANANMDEEALYVGLLGVSPDYQGRGFGRALLIEATETAARLGKRRIDLYTWGGNLKAMPLYKRVGYNWMPGTRVRMESFIPGILNVELFREFFDRYYWYDSLKREIQQEMDDITENGIGVYRYRFVGADGDMLEVLIDREAKGICAFTLTLNGQTLSASVMPDRHVGYIGLGGTGITVTIRNDTGGPLEYDVNVGEAESLDVRFDGPYHALVPDGETVVLGGSYEIPTGIRPLDRTLDDEVKTPCQAHWNITLNGKGIDLHVGILPRQGIDIEMYPPRPVLNPGVMSTVTLRLRNNLPYTTAGTIDLVPLNDVEVTGDPLDFKLAHGESSAIQVGIMTGQSCRSRVVSVEMSAMVGVDGVSRPAMKKTLILPVIAMTGAAAYTALDGLIILENEIFRVEISSRPPMCVVSAEYKSVNYFVRGWGLLPSMGYPFESEHGDLSRQHLDVKLTNTAEYAEVRLSGPSTVKEGIWVTVMYRSYPGRPDLEVVVRPENRSTRTIENIGVELGMWMDFSGRSLYLPLRGHVYCLDGPEEIGRLRTPRKPEYYHEEWAAAVRGDGTVLGVIWDPDAVVEIHPTRRSGPSRVEFQLRDLGPGESVEKSLLRLVFSKGDWQDVRRLWAGLKGMRHGLAKSIIPRHDTEAEILHPSSPPADIMPAVTVVDRNRKSRMELRVRSADGARSIAKIRVNAPHGVLVNGKTTAEFYAERLSIDEPFTAPVDITVKGEGGYFDGGEIEVSLPSRQRRFRFTVVGGDSDGVQRETTVAGEKRLFTVRAGGFEMGVSPDYAASMVRLGPVGGPNVFYDTFPEAKPFVWWERFFTGVRPSFRSRGVWDTEAGLGKERWSIREKNEGFWVGYEMQTRLQYTPKLEGLDVTVTYMLLAGTPIARANVSMRNPQAGEIETEINLKGVPGHEGMANRRIHAIVKGRELVFEGGDDEAVIRPDPCESWVAFVSPADEQVFGVIVRPSSRQVLTVNHVHEDARLFYISDTYRVIPGSTAETTAFFIIPRSISDIRTLRGLSGIH